MKKIIKQIAVLAAVWAVFSWPVAAAESDMGKMIERIAILTGLPETAEPSAVREVSIAEVIRRTKKRYARATYLPGSRQILYAPVYRFLIPHEVTHMLQADAGQNPMADESENQAQWIQSIYCRLWPKECPV